MSIMEIENIIPYGRAYINGFRLVFNPYFFQRGKNKGKVKCYFRKGSKFKSIILRKNEIVLLEKKELE